MQGARRIIAQPDVRAMLGSPVIRMNVKRTTTIVVSGGALAAWLAAAATYRGPDIGEPLVLKSPSIDGRGAALADEISRLHERLHPSAQPPGGSRHFFSVA